MVPKVAREPLGVRVEGGGGGMRRDQCHAATEQRVVADDRGVRVRLQKSQPAPRRLRR